MQKNLHDPKLVWNVSTADDHARHMLVLFCFFVALLLPMRITVADEVPIFNVAQSCRAGKIIASGTDPFAACMQKEQKARDQLKAQWAHFPQDDQRRCIQLCNCGGVAGSYIELLTCLQMAQESRSLPRGRTSIPNSSPKIK